MPVNRHQSLMDGGAEIIIFLILLSRKPLAEFLCPVSDRARISTGLPRSKKTSSTSRRDALFPQNPLQGVSIQFLTNNPSGNPRHTNQRFCRSIGGQKREWTDCVLSEYSTGRCPFLQIGHIRKAASRFSSLPYLRCVHASPPIADAV